MASETRAAILVASDIPYTRVLVRQLVEKQGHRAKTAASIQEAVQKLHEEIYDLVVSDFASPSDGSEQLLLQIRVSGQHQPVLVFCHGLDRDLLRRLNNLRPVGIVRKPLHVPALVELLPLALTADDDLLRRSAVLAAGKPGGKSSKNAVIGAAEVALASASVDHSRLKLMLGDLPVMPHIVARITEVSSEASSGARDLAQVISGEPRLSGQLLKIVNSAYFGFSRRISTIPEAVVILGTEAIRNLALSASVMNLFGGESELVDRAALWRHALAVGVASRLVAERSGMADLDTTFVAGLLHDLGRVVLERHLAEQYHRVLQTAIDEQIPLLEAEERIMGLNHAWVSGWLGKKWNLPAGLADAMAWHHGPEHAAEANRTVAAAVSIGDAIVHKAGLGGIEGIVEPSPPTDYALGSLGFDSADLEALSPFVARHTELLERQLGTAVAEAS